MAKSLVHFCMIESIRQIYECSKIGLYWILINIFCLAFSNIIMFGLFFKFFLWKIFNLNHVNILQTLIFVQHAKVFFSPSAHDTPVV